MTKKKQRLLLKVIKLYKKLGNAHKVAKQVGIAQSTVRRWLRDECIMITKVPRAKDTSEKTKKVIRILYQEYRSTYKVGDILGLDPGVVHRWCRDLVPEHMKKRVFPESVKKKARMLRKKGMSYGAIAKKLGAYEPSVWLWCNS